MTKKEKARIDAEWSKLRGSVLGGKYALRYEDKAALLKSLGEPAHSAQEFIEFHEDRMPDIKVPTFH